MPTQFGADDYYLAGIERMQQARQLFDDGESYALSMYCSGLAVECVLRAFRWLTDRSFDGRHELNELFKASRFSHISDEAMRACGYSVEHSTQTIMELHAAMAEIVTLWRNSLRFTSEAKLKRFLFELGRTNGVKGDASKLAAKSLLSASRVLVDHGTLIWHLRKNSKPR